MMMLPIRTLGQFYGPPRAPTPTLPRKRGRENPMRGRGLTRELGDAGRRRCVGELAKGERQCDQDHAEHDEPRPQ